MDGRGGKEYGEKESDKCGYTEYIAMATEMRDVAVEYTRALHGGRLDVKGRINNNWIRN